MQALPFITVGAAKMFYESVMPDIETFRLTRSDTFGNSFVLST